ncbi:hypothetical protein LEMLEM_LOCUS20950 [Lemmus lemmus]
MREREKWDLCDQFSESITRKHDIYLTCFTSGKPLVESSMNTTLKKAMQTKT